MTETILSTTPEPPSQPTNDSSSLRSLCASLHARIQTFLQEDVETETLRRVQQQTRSSLEAIQEALNRYTLPQLSLSYNGGKDCLVLLILYLASLSTHPHLPPRVQSVYIVPPHPFPSVESFVLSSATTYHLSVARYACESMKAAFATYLHDAEAQGKGIKAIFVGTRRTDPHGGSLTWFDKTDHGWPAFVRCHPVIDWRYVEIWSFLRHLEIPYCELYDQGFTSLGGTTDTHRNPMLAVEGREGVFRPAYELMEDEEERLGRDRPGEIVNGGTGV